jgi:hypothetical protein
MSHTPGPGRCGWLDAPLSFIEFLPTSGWQAPWRGIYAPGEEAAMAKMRAMQIARAGGPLEPVERDMPEPARGEVRVRVEACGVCHSDSLTVEGQWPGLVFPRIRGTRSPG